MVHLELDTEINSLCCSYFAYSFKRKLYTDLSKNLSNHYCMDSTIACTVLYSLTMITSLNDCTFLVNFANFNVIVGSFLTVENQVLK